MSHILVSDGLPPFVLTPESAGEYFNPSAAIGRLKKRSLAMLIRGGSLRRHFVQLLQQHADQGHLLHADPEPERVVGSKR
jgi:hypothetical protein